MTAEELAARIVAHLKAEADEDDDLYIGEGYREGRWVIDGGVDMHALAAKILDWVDHADHTAAH